MAWVELVVGIVVGAAFAPFWTKVWDWFVDKSFKVVKAVMNFLKGVFTKM